MNMRFIVVIALTVSFAFSASSFAALVDNGDYNTDDNGLQWLDLSITQNVAYSQATTTFNSFDGGGWRYASNNEVVGMVTSFFGSPSYMSGLNNSLAGGYILNVSPASSLGVAASDWMSIFGLTYNISNQELNQFSYGTYSDENNILRTAGVLFWALDSTYRIFGPDYTKNLDSRRDQSDPYYGAFLVRDGLPSAVPIPAAAFMFAPALLGFLGLRRRAKNKAI